MDDIAAALADLGLERRELISTTEGDRSGGPVANRSERLHQMKMQDIEGRRETNKRVSHWNGMFSKLTSSLFLLLIPIAQTPRSFRETQSQSSLTASTAARATASL